MRKKLPLNKVKKKAWDAMSLWVRRSNANAHEIVHCYTCDGIHVWKDVQGGHFVHGFTHPSYLNEDNVRPQCVGCNKWRKGNPFVYERKLREEIGNERVDALLAMRYQIWKPNRQELEAIILKYKTLVNELMGARLKPKRGGYLGE